MRNLTEAWTKRVELISEAKNLVAKALTMDKDRFPVPKNSKVTTWMASMDAYHLAEGVRSEADHKFHLADIIWHDAVLKEKGNIRVDWSDGVSGWNCKLETGEEFLS